MREAKNEGSGLAVGSLAWSSHKLCSVIAVSTFPHHLTFLLSNVETDAIPSFLQDSEAVQMEDVM